MLNKRLIKNILFFTVFIQGFSLLLALGNTIVNPNYQPSNWQYLVALLGSTLFGSLLVIRIGNKKELLELFFGIKEDKQQPKKQ